MSLAKPLVRILLLISLVLLFHLPGRASAGICSLTADVFSPGGNDSQSSSQACPAGVDASAPGVLADSEANSGSAFEFGEVFLPTGFTTAAYSANVEIPDLVLDGPAGQSANVGIHIFFSVSGSGTTPPGEAQIASGSFRLTMDTIPGSSNPIFWDLYIESRDNGGRCIPRGIDCSIASWDELGMQYALTTSVSIDKLALVGVPFALRITLFGLVRASGAGGDAIDMIEYELLPFTTPPGFSVNSASSNVVDNVWMGTPVPEPGVSTMLAAGGVLLAGLSRRRSRGSSQRIRCS